MTTTTTLPVFEQDPFATARPYGKLTSVTGLIFEATGLNYPVGTTCYFENANERHYMRIVGFKTHTTQLMALHRPPAPYLGQRVYVNNSTPVMSLPGGPALLGRVLDPDAAPLDQLPPPSYKNAVTLSLLPINPMLRRPIEHPMDVGVKAINSLLTIGQGQRMGIFAGSGVGKSTLLGMMSRHSNADVVIVALIGERGREVKEFIDVILGPAKQKSIVIAAAADASPLLKMQGAEYACALAQQFRDTGQHVLLIMDSVTRYAMAAREIGLAVGEPPATKGYPPSAFSKISSLIESVGNSQSLGSITAFFTVLSEGDDMQDPVADTARAIMDGHIVLSRRLADQGHYPPIDVGASVSRAFTSITTKPHQQAARKFKQLRALYNDNQDLINVGAYSKGSDPNIDEAIAKNAFMQTFLQQTLEEKLSLEQSIAQMTQLVNTK